MTGYIRLIAGGVMASLFIISIILFSANFAIDNESEVSILSDSRYSGLNSTLRSNLTNFQTESQTSQEILFKTTLESGDEHASTGGQFKVGPLTAVGMAVSSFGTAFSSIFGDEFSFISLSFVGLLTFILGYYTIKAWLGRSPD